MKEKRPGVYQLFAPFYHEDGDMYDIFLKRTEHVQSEDKFLKLTDYGMTLMRLSYAYDLDTPNKEKILHKILASNYLKLDEKGRIYLETDLENLISSILIFAQGIAKVSNMKLYQREVVHSLFFDTLKEFIENSLAQYQPVKNYHPLSNEAEYEVDYFFNNRQRPLYLFGVNSSSKAKLATISCLKFQNEKVPFKSIIVLEDIDVLPKEDSKRLMSVSDKQFPSIEDFEKNGQKYFERESELEVGIR